MDAFDGRIERFVHLSTVSVNRLTSGFPLKETDPLVSDPMAGYAYDKAECERALHQAHAKSDFPFVSIRPTVIFGPRDRISRENYFLKRILSGDAIVLADGGLLPIFAIYVRDVAAAIAGAIVSPTASGRAYHLAMRERVQLAGHVENLAAIAGRSAESVAVPSRVLERVGFNLRSLPYYSGGRLVELDTSAAERDLDFRPTSYAEAVAATAHYFLGEGPESLPSIEDRFPPAMPRSRQSRFAREYRDRLATFEDSVVADTGDLMDGFR